MNKFYNFLTLSLTICCSNLLFGQNINLHYENEQLSITGATGVYNLDIMIQSDETTTLGSGDLYFDYNSNAFGANAVSNGNITLSVPNGFWLAQKDNNSGTVNIYSFPKISDSGSDQFKVSWEQVIEGACMEDLPVGQSEALFHLEMNYIPNGINFGTGLCFSQSPDDELFTACGNNSFCNGLAMNCTTYPSAELTDISYDCASVVLPCPGNSDEDGDGICVGEDCDDTDPNIGGEGSPCDDGNDCTINDQYDAFCNCLGTYQDSDEDGVCDGQDLCEGFDDSIDFNNNGTPDGCENGADPSCISFWFIPQDKTIDCAATPVFNQPAGADNCCSNPDLTFTFIDTEIGSGCTKKIERIWIAESECGNMRTVKQTITLVDTEAPKFIISHSLFGLSNDGDTLTIDCDDNLFIVPGDVEIEDNCDENATVNMYDQIEDGHCPTDGYIKFLYCYWVAEDACGNRDTFDIYAKFVDTTAPEIECPDDIEIQCFESTDPSVTGEAIASDDCTDVTVTYSDKLVQDFDCEDIIERTWYAVDDCENIDSCTQIITIVDSTPPLVNCPSDLTVDCDDPTDVASTGSASANDSCGGTTISFQDDFQVISDCEQKIERTWTAVDDCNNVSNCIQTINIQDLTPPEITCPDLIIVECSDGADPNNTGFPTASDICDSNLDVTYSDDTTIVNGCEFIIDRTWTATDDCGNATSCMQVIKVIDSIDPVITCPVDITIECDESTAPMITGEASATDLCDSDVAIGFEDVSDINDCTGLITRTWLAADNCGNTVECTQIISIIDSTAPEITCPADLTIQCDASTNPNETGTASATDNCDQDVTVTFEDSENNISDCELEITRTWTAEDNCGNTTTCIQVIFVTDTTHPIINCPIDIEIECDASTDPANTGFATATEDCDNDVDISYDDELIVVDDCTSQILRTWTATNDCGLTATCVQSITITDTTAPTIECPDDVTVDCDAANDPNATGYPITFDNCDQSLDISWEDDFIVISDCESFLSRTWTAVDNCGNEVSCVQKITLLDMSDPTITCPADVTIECDASSDPSNTGEPTGADNCDQNLVFTFEDENNVLSSCESEIIRTWTAMDDCGNTATCQQRILITDTTAPEITCPQDLTVECDASTLPSETGEPFAFDNCDPALDVTYEDQTSQPNDCETIITRTWTATDDCGNVATCTQIIILTDTTAPEIVCPSDLEVECNTAYDPSVTGIATGSDNCDSDLTIEFSDNEIQINDCELVIERTWTATDDCGNVATCTQTIKVIDTIAPEIECASDKTIECDASTDPSVTGMPIVTDNCDMDITVSFNDEVQSQDDCTTIIIRTWTATDDCGNSANCIQTITITDTQAPEITCPQDVTIECNSDDSPYTQGFATATDNCDTDISISWNDEILTPNDCETTINRTWTATDNCGNSVTCVQVILKVDTTPPTNSCPQPITVECDQATDPTVTGEPFAFDNCDPDLDISFEDEITNSDGCTTVLKRVWSAEDNCGNISTCEQFITVTDSTPPTIDCPADQTLECDQPTDPTTTGEPIVADNCDTDLEVSYLDNVIQVSDCETIIERTWTVSDDCDNSVSCVQTLKIIDTVAPEIECPSDKTIECDASSDPSVTGMPIVTDNCDVDISLTFIDDTISNDGCNIILDRKWTAADDCGNEVSCNQTITITDTQAPEITCPQDVTIECNSDDSPYTQGFATATDNCDSDISVSWTDEILTPNDCETTINRTWTATDDCGNSVTCVQVIRKVDTTPPVNTCPQNITVDCQEASDPAITGEPFAFDNCDPDLDITFEDEITSMDDCQTVTQRTWSAEDNCGNVSTCVQFITQIDTQMPTITCPADTTLECDSDFDPSITGAATAIDDCDTDVEISFADQISGDNCSMVINRIWTATDNCGNVAQCEQVISLVDTTAPEITCPDDITLECDVTSDPANTGSPTTVDNCDSDPTLTYEDEILSNTGCEIVTIRTWTATDDCGNSVTCTQTITTIDTGLPSINCPSDLTLNCSDSTDPSATGEPFAFDACDPTLDITFSDEMTDDGCTQIIERTWTATDDCGNQASCVQTITIEDNEAPIITCPDDMVVDCDQPVTFTDPVVSDNCDLDIEIIFQDDTTFVSACEYVISRTWTATDDCGNTAECIQSISIIDNSAPEIICPADVETTCDQSTDPANTGMPTATDNCDSDLDIDFTDVTTSNSDCEIITERTWTATDDCGNTVSCVQIIKLVDDVAPVISCPAWVTINCDEGTDPSNTGEATATDNCAMPTVTFVDSLDQISICELDIYRTWTATDDCGNTAECFQVIKVVDLIAPEIICPDDTTVECDASIDPQDLGFAIGTDNCDQDVDITYSDNEIVIDECTTEIQRTWTATDDCGFTVTCVQIITVTDTQAPQITCPDDTVLECDEVTDPSMTGMPTAIDNCDANVSITFEDEIIQTSACEYVINRTWTATDNCGNEANCLQVITVTDQTAPTITCPDDTTVECDGPSDPTITGEATATDVCDQDVTINYMDNIVTGTNCDSYIERTWTATDDCGNTESCVQIINIIDSEIPTINCPQNQTIECTDSTDPSVTGEPFAFDNCDPTLDITYSDEEVIVDDCTTEIQRTWTATDDCGNVGTCVQTITITDTTSPTISCPANAYLECGSSIDPSVTGMPTGDDNCSVDLQFTYSDDTVSVDSCNIIIERTWTATDDCGNTETCLQKITLTDTTAPELAFDNPLLNGLTNGDTIQIECDSSTFNENDVVVTDNCDDSPAVMLMQNSVPGDCNLNGIKETITYQWIGKDACGNMDTLSIIVEVIDTTPPTITPDHPMINGAQSGDTLVIDCENFWFLGEEDVIIEDACGDATVSFEEEIFQSDCTINGGLKVTMVCSWIATDDCGNADTLTLIMQVVDTTAPQLIDVPADTTLTCAEIPAPANVLGEDGCDGDVSVDFKEYINPPTGGSQSCELVREWSASDECGNMVVQSQVITVVDCIGCFLTNNPTFITFEASTDGEVTQLDWEFTSITMPHIFTVQRSADKEHFYDIGVLEGRMNFTTDSDWYSFVDQEPRLGNNFYRIKALNIGDVPIYSDTLSIRYLQDTRAKASNYQIYPNPTNSEVQLEFLTEVESEVTISIHNELGILVSEEVLPAETIIKTIDLSDVPAGVYYLTIDFSGRKLQVERIIKLH
jgi:hypothetical protein